MRTVHIGERCMIAVFKAVNTPGSPVTTLRDGASSMFYHKMCQVGILTPHRAVCQSSRQTSLARCAYPTFTHVAGLVASAHEALLNGNICDSVYLHTGLESSAKDQRMPNRAPLTTSLVCVCVTSHHRPRVRRDDRQWHLPRASCVRWARSIPM
jgi:hypothetical protein